ncbi:MAG: hypothetical protein K1Y36_16520 [Blastocatellia bacterium]|nr:hypothetical protein [Blastocatellia bacterium]
MLSRAIMYCYKCHAPMQSTAQACEYCGAFRPRNKQENRNEPRKIVLADQFNHRGLTRWSKNLGQWEVRDQKLIGRGGTHYYGITHTYSFDSRKEYTFRVNAQTRGATGCFGFISPSLDYGIYLFFHREGHFDKQFECRFWRGGDTYDFITPRHEVNMSFGGERRYAFSIRQGVIRISVDNRFLESVDVTQLLTGRYLFSMSNYNPPTSQRIAEHIYSKFQVTAP